jgi:uncharacterized coiled-coil protein SlyX
MDWVNIITAIGTTIAALGGFEYVKWLFTRNSRARIAKAEATSKEVQASADEYYLLRERLEVADRQLIEKETRFMEQTELVRNLNKQLVDKTTIIGNLQAEISALKAERALKLCERRGCKRREPQSPY